MGNESSFKFEFNLKSRNGDTIGSVFIKPLPDNKEVFSSLLIKGVGTSKDDTLYFIKANIFRNSKGIDIKVYEKNLYGYRFIKKNENSFIIMALHNGGKMLATIFG